MGSAPLNSRLILQRHEPGSRSDVRLPEVKGQQHAAMRVLGEEDEEDDDDDDGDGDEEESARAG